MNGKQGIEGQPYSLPKNYWPAGLNCVEFYDGGTYSIEYMPKTVVHPVIEPTTEEGHKKHPKRECYAMICVNHPTENGDTRKEVVGFIARAKGKPDRLVLNTDNPMSDEFDSARKTIRILYTDWSKKK